MSAKREQIIDSLVSIYTAQGGWTTTVRTITTRVPEHWMEHPPGQCPALYVQDADSAETPIAFPESGAEDMQADMSVFIAGVVWSEDGDNKSARNNILADVKAATFGYANASPIITDVVSARVSTDRGMLPKYSHFSLEIILRYLYAQSEGG